LSENKSNRDLRTSNVAASVGVHPNTVHLYEAWGFLPPIPRTPNGYRHFAEFHVDETRNVGLQLAQLAQ